MKAALGSAGVLLGLLGSVMTIVMLACAGATPAWQPAAGGR